MYKYMKNCTVGTFVSKSKILIIIVPPFQSALTMNYRSRLVSMRS